MKLPTDFEKFQASKEFSQSDLMIARKDSIYKTLVAAKSMMEQRPETITTTTKDLYRQNATALQEAMDGVAGVCQCLAIKWLKLKMKEQRQGLKGSNKVGGDARVDKLRLDKALAMAAHRQSESGKKQVYTMVFDEAMKMYNVTALPGWDKQMTLKDTGSRIVGTTHAYFVIGINTPKYKGNHAIAAYTSSGSALGMNKHVYLFDPNYGELMFPKGQFGSLFGKLVQACYQTGENDVKILAQLNAK